LPTFASEAERREILDYFSRRFGMPEKAFEGFRFLKGGRKIWVVRDHPELKRILQEMRVESAGIPLLRTKASGWKPTTDGLQAFGRHATRNVVELGEEDLPLFLGGKTLEAPSFLEPGFAVIRRRGKILGCAVCGKGKIRSQIPRRRVEPIISSNFVPGSEPP
jgi:NOL1/NOP2/fmu family ribosome biogenesis protein